MPRGGRWKVGNMGVQQASSFAAVAHAAKTSPIPPVLQCAVARGQGQGTAERIGDCTLFVGRLALADEPGLRALESV